MDIYRARSQNAYRIAGLIKQYLESGEYLILTDQYELIHSISIDDYEIVVSVSPTHYITLFVNDKNVDDGMHTPIAEFNSYFDDWLIVEKKHLKRLAA